MNEENKNEHSLNMTNQICKAKPSIEIETRNDRIRKATL